MAGGLSSKPAQEILVEHGHTATGNYPGQDSIRDRQEPDLFAEVITRHWRARLFAARDTPRRTGPRYPAA